MHVQTLPQLMVVLIALAVAGTCFREAYRLYAIGRHARNWPQVDGRVTYSEVEEERDSDYNRVYRANVQYTYSFGDKEHLGYRSAAGADDWGQQRRSRERIVGRFPAGSVVRVYVNPSRPSESLLDPGNNSQVWWYAIIGLMAVGTAAVGVFGDVTLTF